jgi:hypothetical protein
VTQAEEERRMRGALCGAENATGRTAHDEIECGAFLLRTEGVSAAVERWQNAYRNADNVADACEAVQRIEQSSASIDQDLAFVSNAEQARCNQLAQSTAIALQTRLAYESVERSCAATCAVRRQTCDHQRYHGGIVGLIQTVSDACGNEEKECEQACAP